MTESYDFSNSKRGAVAKNNKERITIRLDPEILQWFRNQVAGGGNYQSMINNALKQHIEQANGETLEATLRRVIREEIHHKAA